MIGDSIVRRLDGYVQSSQATIINAGCGGDTASNVLWRVQEMRLPSKASLGFIHCGINDIQRVHSLASSSTPQTIANNIMQCGVQLKECNPMTDVVVLGLVLTKDQRMNEVVEQVNQHIETACF